jgi:hypothetical protein
MDRVLETCTVILLKTFDIEVHLIFFINWDFKKINVLKTCFSVFLFKVKKINKIRYWHFFYLRYEFHANRMKF